VERNRNLGGRRGEFARVCEGTSVRPKSTDSSGGGGGGIQRKGVEDYDKKGQKTELYSKSKRE